MKDISLDAEAIALALPRLAHPLCQYLSIQERLSLGDDFAHDQEFRRQFNYFYRVRRNSEWQDTYYALMTYFHGRNAELSDVLKAIRRSTGRVEASFASKLLASLQPTHPIIDSIVFRYLGVRLPYAYEGNRVEKIADLYARLEVHYHTYLETPDGMHLISEFRCRYPDGSISPTKILDFVLWQQRS